MADSCCSDILTREGQAQLLALWLAPRGQLGQLISGSNAGPLGSWGGAGVKGSEVSNGADPPFRHSLRSFLFVPEGLALLALSVAEIRFSFLEAALAIEQRQISEAQGLNLPREIHLNDTLVAVFDGVGVGDQSTWEVGPR